MDIYLRALEPEDFEITHSWRNNETDGDLLVGMKRFVSRDTERRWVLSAIEKHERGEEFRFAICDKVNNKLVGLVSAVNIDYHHRTFYISNLIGDVGSRGKGVISKANMKFLKYMFNEVGMNKAIYRVLESNTPSIRSIEKFGFTEEGVLRQAAFKRGRYESVVIYGMLKNEFNQK